MKRLWDKGESVASDVLKFTTGKDPELDLRLLEFDCIGTAAHVRMLSEIGLFPKEELKLCLDELDKLYQLSKNGNLHIPLDLEDCHSTIEAHLTNSLGEIGKKIHLGRSRNDQIQVTLRLYLKHWVSQTISTLINLAEKFSKLSQEFMESPLPGYTHMQPAMPTSLGVWYGAFAEGFSEAIEEGISVYNAINKNPLGSGSGFDSSLPIRKDITAKLLNFSKIQANPIDVQNSRGRIESRILSWLSTCAFVWEKFAWDVILFSSKEFEVFSLAENITTGSSLMPQKRNPDVFELIRGSAGSVRGALTELLFVAGKLPSNYHRDFQLSKDPLFRGIDTASSVFAVLPAAINGIKYNKDKAAELMYPELYATYAVFEKINDGVPFRDAYQKTAADLKTKLPDPQKYSDAFIASVSQYKSGLDSLIKILTNQREVVAQMIESESKVSNSIFCLAEILK